MNLEVERFLNGDAFTMTFRSTGHAGEYIALVEDGEAVDGFRRLAPGLDGDVYVLQAVCICGWRSPRFNAPPGTRWFRGGVAVARDYVEGASAILDRLARWHFTAPLSHDN